ncbi:PspC domain-containing protein [Plebeiibacterium sediminum]|uniref:PspC domain-containing protein n=1 Tax=Plebeiibacterium sediminum TaxID=2992112 RepID=A0AAE3M2E5_9BACT|nr:PspC domain-containing protein [Plebeiobacterium sediminum]MCW3785839.1 PspC domain-containing protein [Plebeiobacterium sediminum]
MILGVCEWLSYKLGYRVGMIRLAFLIAALFFGTGVGVYLILWIIKTLLN